MRPVKALPPVKTGLKAVKLNMTPDQARAFISRMSGLMIVTGAPGSGKPRSPFSASASFSISRINVIRWSPRPVYAPAHPRLPRK